MLRLIILFSCLVGVRVAAAEPVGSSGDAIKANRDRLARRDRHAARHNRTHPFHQRRPHVRRGRGACLAAGLGHRPRPLVDRRQSALRQVVQVVRGPAALPRHTSGWHAHLLAAGRRRDRALRHSFRLAMAGPQSRHLRRSLASAGEQAGKAQALGGLPHANPPQKFVTANAAAEPSSPATLKPSPTRLPARKRPPPRPPRCIP